VHATNEERIKHPVGVEPKDPRERKGKDGCVALLGRSHRGSPEAEDTLTMIPHGVEISIPGGGADEKDERIWEAFFFSHFFFISYICC